MPKCVKAVLNQQHDMLSWRTKQLFNNILTHISGMNVTFNWLPRDQISLAHCLASYAARAKTLVFFFFYIFAWEKKGKKKKNNQKMVVDSPLKTTSKAQIRNIIIP